MSDKVPKPLGVLPLGDAAAYVEFSDSLDLEVNDAVQRLAAAVHARALPWIRDVVPALGGLALHFDIEHEALPDAPLQAAAGLIEECLKAGLPDANTVGRALEVPICYDPELALDLEELAARLRQQHGVKATVLPVDLASTLRASRSTLRTGREGQRQPGSEARDHAAAARS